MGTKTVPTLANFQRYHQACTPSGLLSRTSLLIWEPEHSRRVTYRQGPGYEVAYKCGNRCNKGGLWTNNDFNLANALVPIGQIKHGDPGRDDIPAIRQPDFISAAQANFLGDADRFWALTYGTSKKPIRPVPHSQFNKLTKRPVRARRLS